MEATIAKSQYETERGKPIPSLNHAIVQQNLVFQMKLKYGDKFSILPEINVEVVTNRDRVPDIAIYPVIEFVPEADVIHMTETPLGVIEILSPKQDLTELIQKSSEYFKKGVKSYWLVLPSLQSIYVFSAPGEYENFNYREVLRDEQLEIELDLKEIFR
jgi:Uma2 family endonuclease